MYKDRKDAGEKLGKAMKKFRGQNGIVLAVPRGGVPVGYYVAKELGFPMELLLAKKIGHPSNPEYAIGAVSLTDSFIAPQENISQDYINHEIRRVRSRLEEMNAKFNAGIMPSSLRNKTVIVVDDGIATGNTLLSTIAMLRGQRPAKIIIAVPVASSSSINKLSQLVDEIVCPWIPEWFSGVGAFYEDFEQVGDEEVIRTMKNFRNQEEKSS